MSLHRTRWTGCLLAAAFVAVGSPAAAQFPPDTLRNIKVLDPTMRPSQVIGVMRGFALGLGVRCEHCHVGEPGDSLATFDFASDEKPTKLKAREMFRMVEAINTQHLANLSERSDPPINVTCQTCHHGLAKPVTTQSVLIATAQTDGVDAAVAQYKELREEYYGTYSYDFSELVLAEVARAVIRSSGPAETLKLLTLNLEHFPNSIPTLVGLGQTYSQLGDKEAAIRYLERALELQPDTPQIRRMLEQVRGG